MRTLSALTEFAILMIVIPVVLQPLLAVQSKSLAGTWKVSWTEANHSPQEVSPLFTLPMKDTGRPAPPVLKTGNEVALRQGK